MMGVSLTVLRDAMCLAESQRFMSYLTFLGRTWRGVDGDAETSSKERRTGSVRREVASLRRELNARQLESSLVNKRLAT